MGLMLKRQTSCLAQPVHGLGFGMHAFGTLGHVHRTWGSSAMAMSMQKPHGLSLWKMLIISLTVQGSLKDISVLVTLLGLFSIKQSAQC